MYKSAFVELDGQKVSLFLVDEVIVSSVENGAEAYERLRSECSDYPIWLIAKPASGGTIMFGQNGMPDLTNLVLEDVEWATRDDTL